MYESGNWRLTFKYRKHAEEVFLFVKNALSDYESWCNALELEENTIKVEYDVYMPTCDYRNLLLGICIDLAESYPDYEFTSKSDCSDDECYLSFDECGSFENGVFNYESRVLSCEGIEPDFIEDSVPEDFDFEELEDEYSPDKELIETIVGKFIDGKIKYTSTFRYE